MHFITTHRKSKIVVEPLKNKNALIPLSPCKHDNTLFHRTLFSLSHHFVEPATKLGQADAFSVRLHVIKVM